jgi:sugar O-acyltransferase (sialic acid O-acetyltransferase NeuD family)
VVSRVPQRLLIFPCNGNGIEALDCVGAGCRLIGFVDDTPEKQGEVRFGHRILPREALREYADAHVLAVPGSAASYRSRGAIITSLGISDRQYARVVHPSARVSPLATIGYNVLIMAGAVVTSNAVIGNHVCVLPNTVIHHDVVVGDLSLIGANVTIAGGTTLGENCYIGSGSALMNGLHIGERALIGLGSNVIRNVPAGAKVAGNPAREVGGKTANAD